MNYNDIFVANEHIDFSCLPGLDHSVLEVPISLRGCILREHVAGWILRVIFLIEFEEKVSPGLRSSLVGNADHGASPTAELNKVWSITQSTYLNGKKHKMEET